MLKVKQSDLIHPLKSNGVMFPIGSTLNRHGHGEDKPRFQHACAENIPVQKKQSLAQKQRFCVI
ncbi:MAG: hypothetical protein OXR07_05950 [Nitrospira sp.]|nr:hypothetical protein [Nitrospira sp.]MDD9859622.1 hypothetical protein [Nitrospira sp.]